MGYQLRREVLKMLPKGGVLTDKEARLILEVADRCDDRTRQGWPGADYLADVCDIPNVKRVGEFFTSIARKWVELRVELGKDRHGKPYYAKAGHKTVYRIPTRSELDGTDEQMQVPATRGPEVPALRGPERLQVPAKEGPEVPALGGPAHAVQVPAKGGPSSSKIYSSSSSSEEDEDDSTSKVKVNPTVQAIADALTLTTDQAERVFRTKTPAYVASPARWWAQLIANGDVTRYASTPVAGPTAARPGAACRFTDADGDDRCDRCGYPADHRRHRAAA